MMSYSYFDDFVRQLEDYERKFMEERDKELAKLCQENDFIVGSTGLKHDLEERLPKGTNIVYSQFIDDPTMVIMVKKFSMIDLLGADMRGE